MSAIPKAAIEAAVDVLCKSPREVGYFELNPAHVDALIGSMIEAALPHLGEPVAWQYMAGLGIWRQCSPQVMVFYQQYGISVRTLYLAPPEPAVKVKPLEWTRGKAGGLFSYEYSIHDLGQNWAVDRFEVYVGDIRLVRLTDEETAKAFVQSHHEARILSALVEQPAQAAPEDGKAVEPVAHLVWRQGRRAADDFEDYYEIARPGDKSIDGSDPFPVYAKPIEAPAIPEGWKLVPVRPTREMLAAADTADRKSEGILGNTYQPAVTCGGFMHWSAMLAAAPEPPLTTLTAPNLETKP